MSSREIFAVEGDDDKVVGVTLYDDDVAVDLTGESITCHMLNASTGTVTSITGLTGDASGNVSTPIVSANLVAGRWYLEWQVVDGLTYPAKAGQRPILYVRTEHA